MEMIEETIAQRVDAVRKAIDAAAVSSGRRPEDIELMAAVKTRSAEEVAELLSAGVSTIGENRVQEGMEHTEQLSAMSVPAFRAHFIGRIQSNKIRRIAGVFDSIDSIDGEKTALRVAHVAMEEHLEREVMIEVNVGEEPQKGGVLPGEVEGLAAYISDLEGVELTGLMGIPPWSENPEASRPHFRKLKDIFEKVRQKHPRPERFRFLSMGMSNDFAVAVEEGATMVRVGTALFGPRRQK